MTAKEHPRARRRRAVIAQTRRRNGLPPRGRGSIGASPFAVPNDGFAMLSGLPPNDGFVMRGSAGASPFVHPNDGYAQLSGANVGPWPMYSPGTGYARMNGYAVGELLGQATWADMARSPGYSNAFQQWLGRQPGTEPADFLVTPSVAPHRELYRVLTEVGAEPDKIGVEAALRRFQKSFGLPETGLVDDMTIDALDRWGSDFSVRLERALTQLGTPIQSRADMGEAVRQIQYRFGLPVTGALDQRTMQILQHAYEPSDEELVAWLTLESPKTYGQYLVEPGGMIHDVDTGAEEIKKILPDPFGWMKRFVKRVGKDWRTYAGLAGSIAVRTLPFVSTIPYLSILPAAGALIYELTDEIAKDEA